MGRSNIAAKPEYECETRMLQSYGFLLWRGSAMDWEVSAIAAQEPRLNEEITVRECRLIGFDGEQMVFT